MFEGSEYDRWIRQAERTLKSAERDLEHKDYEWASFKAQQAAELAMKAITRALGIMLPGHSITKLLKALEEHGIKVPEELYNMAMELDRNYITSRYPLAYSEGSPYEYYSEEIARKLINYAKELVEFGKRIAVQKVEGGE
ncbi:HEPN domain-containing protein [Pyrococcus kukulkanii]|uniref:HEPN domain-containing protein n=1 Tax=Pyrococcus kukulkanii TaxID=1609559 RepID=UPI000F2D2BE7|nr:MAG: DNA-binding protein [Thermococci archaeon]